MFITLTSDCCVEFGSSTNETLNPHNFCIRNSKKTQLDASESPFDARKKHLQLRGRSNNRWPECVEVTVVALSTLLHKDHTNSPHQI